MLAKHRLVMLLISMFSGHYKTILWQWTFLHCVCALIIISSHKSNSGEVSCFLPTEQCDTVPFFSDLDAIRRRSLKNAHSTTVLSSVREKCC
jgi:hypothetical protein